tara:strand:+ start:34316 stop:35533 length:1218 start_codon:yes stop_codon:yes gene_type:complete
MVEVQEKSISTVFDIQKLVKNSYKKVDYNTQEYYELYNSVEEDFNEYSVSTEDSRVYQISTVAKSIHLLNHNYNRILIVKPTGTGKTLISRTLFSSRAMRKALGIEGDRPLRLLFVANKHRLLEQAIRTYDYVNNIEIITLSTSQKHFPQDLIDNGWDVTCLDEAHHESMTSFQLFLDSINEVPLFGLTATPNRPDGCILKFDIIIQEITRREAVEQKYLAETDIISINDISGNNKVPKAKKVFMDFYDDFGQTIITFKTKKEVKEFSDFLISQRIFNFVSITEQSGSELSDILDAFSRKEFQFIINCNKINEGIDVKNCDTIFLARSYSSEIELNQMIGRASRPDCDCKVIELLNPLKNTLSAIDIVEVARNHKLVSYQNKNIIVYDFKNSNTKPIEIKECVNF